MAAAIKTVVDKLNGRNYFVWKFRMEHLLKKEKLWTAVEKNAPALAADGSNEKEVELFNEKEEEALAWIVSLVDDSQLVHIRAMKTAKTAWKALKDHHEKNTLSNKVTLMRRICSTKLEEGDAIEEHLSVLSNLFQQLEDMGETFQDGWKVAMLLGSLPQSFDTLITALEARNATELTFDFVHEKLLAQQNRKAQDGDGEAVLKAMAKPSKERTCFFCKGVGHFKKDCLEYKQWKKKKEGTGQGGKANKEKVHKVEKGATTEMLFTVVASDGNDKKDDEDVKGDTELICTMASNCSKSDWVADSGATCHVAGDKQQFTSLQPTTTKLQVANGREVMVEGKGDCKFEVVNGEGQIRKMALKDVLFAPSIQGNLLSVKRLVQDDYVFIFGKEVCEIRKDGIQVAVIDGESDLYKVRKPNKVYLVQNGHKENCIHNLHRIFGHRDPAAIREMLSKEMVDGIKISDCGIKAQCEVCLKAKVTRLPFESSKGRSNTVLDLIHTDVCGPMQTCSPGGKRYVLTFIDDFSRYTTIYLLKEKSEVRDKLKEFVAMMKTKFGHKPKVFRSDRGGEYVGNKLQEWLKLEGIQAQFTAPYTPQQNGVAERKNRSLIEMARCMLEDAGLEKIFWAEAVNTAVYLQNRLPSRSISKTPFELWNGKAPNVKHCIRFGAKCIVHVPVQKRRKLDNTGVQMIFVGYDGAAYRCYDPVKRKVTISRDVRCLQEEQIEIEVCEIKAPIKDDDLENVIKDFHQENQNDFEQKNTAQEYDELGDHDSGASDDDENISAYESFTLDSNDDGSNISDVSVNTEVEVASGNERRVSQRSNKGIPPKRLMEEIFLVNGVFEPKTVSEALSSKDKQKWSQAMQEEMDSLKKNGTWVLSKLPEGRSAIGCKWVFKLKTNANGDIVRYKARLVAQGFSQKFGADYDQVFAPVARQTTFRMLLAIASKENYNVLHIDAKTAFLNGELKETIYMKQPPGFVQDNEKVCWLRKSIYGLKQAARSWNEAIHTVLTNGGFKQSKADTCLYTCMLNRELVLLLIYVDDMVLLVKSQTAAKMVKKMISSKYEIEDLGEIKHYLGIKITKTADGTYQLDQSTYIKQVAFNFGLANAKESKTPMNVGYGKTEEKAVMLATNRDYQKLIGCLLYVAINTRPDIAASISILSQKTVEPNQEDWNELKRVVKYLKGTVDLKLTLGNKSWNRTLIYGYADANWAEKYVSRKSNSGYVFFLHGGLVSWACRKQTCVALSSTEAEFVALSEACQEAFWLKRLLNDMQQNITTAITIYEDNQSCLNLIKEEKLSNRTKHIDTRYIFVKDYIDKGIITCEYCPTEKMLADLLTKPLAASKHIEMTKQCGLYD